MKVILFLCGLALVAGSETWENFKLAHGKSYSNGKEELYRKAIFEDNLKYVDEHNERFRQGLVTFDLKMNKYGDMKSEEFVSQMTGLKKVDRQMKEVFGPFPEAKRADTVDWRDKGAVTAVKDQGLCGSDWAFSTTGAIEAAHFIAHGELISLSEQQLVDCSHQNIGCSGGIVQWAYEDIKEDMGGIQSESSYPYETQEKSCRLDESKFVCSVNGFVQIPYKDEVTQAQAVHDVGPVSVCIDAGHLSFQLYSSGIYYEPECNPKAINHDALAVGYGTEGGSDYWLIKNSWGTDWGEGGYIKITRNKDNHCGVATKSCYPLHGDI